jgi:hypothetical protein
MTCPRETVPVKHPLMSHSQNANLSHILTCPTRGEVYSSSVIFCVAKPIALPRSRRP